MSIQILQQGSGELIGWHDPDENRQWVREHKSRDLRDKRMSVKEAVEEFVHDGNFVAFGGFGHIRIPMAVVYEIIRQQKRGLVMAGKTAVHDIDLLIGAGCVNKVEVAYAFGVCGFEEYLDLAGGVRKLNYLKRVEQFKEPMRAPWLKDR